MYIAGYINAIHTRAHTHTWARVHTTNICNEKLTTLRGKKYSRNSGSGIDRVEYERHIGPAMMYRESRFLFLQFWLMRIKCIDIACTTLWPLQSISRPIYKISTRGVVPRYRERNYGIICFFFEQSPEPRIILVNFVIIIRIITLRTRSRCFQGKLDPLFGCLCVPTWYLLCVSYSVLCDIIILTLNGVDKLVRRTW